jgi:MscS family membrane protein
MLTGAGSRVYNHTIHLELDTPPDKIIAVIESIRSMLVDHPQAKRETILVNLTEISENALCVQVVCDFGVPAWNEYQALKQEVNLNILTILQQHAVLLSQSMSNVAVQVKR